jgi:hypothetical protein
MRAAKYTANSPGNALRFHLRGVANEPVARIVTVMASLYTFQEDPACSSSPRQEILDLPALQQMTSIFTFFLLSIYIALAFVFHFSSLKLVFILLSF